MAVHPLVDLGRNTRFKPRYDLPEDYLRKKVFSDLMTDRQIAEEVGCTAGTIRYRLRKFRIRRDGLARPRTIFVGMRHRMLEVVEFLGRGGKYDHLQWRCRCDCGKERVLECGRIMSALSCGCARVRSGIESPTWRGFGEVSGRYWSAVKRSASERGISVSVTIKDLWELFVYQGGKCALTGIDLVMNGGSDLSLQTASLDRIDSRKPYECENIQWVHKDINTMKTDLDQDEFVHYCRLVARLDDAKHTWADPALAGAK